MDFWDWFDKNWLALIGDVAIPLGAILVSTLIAIRLARGERRDARADSDQQRRLESGAEVLLALAPLASMHANESRMQEHLWALRARIAVYRAWIAPGDISGDWLAYRHREGMRLWAAAMMAIDDAGGLNRLTVEMILDVLAPPHSWAAETTEMLSGWMRGEVTQQQLAVDGERIRLSLPAGDPMRGEA